MIQVSPGKQNICAIIVTYFPDSGLAGRVAAIARQVGRVIIVDNDSGENHLAELKALTQAPTIDLIVNERNLGVATALNIGVQRARELSADWVLLFDQDTVVNGDLVEGLVEVYHSCDEPDKIAVIGANFYHEATGRAYFSGDNNGLNSLEKKSVITSGSLVPIRCIDELGGFVDELFIDYVDHEFCFRARRHGYKVLLSCRPLMQHAIGGLPPRKIPMVKSLPTRNAAIRDYYIARNNLYMLKNYLRSEPAYMIRHQLSVLACLLSVIFVQDDKLKKLSYFAKGIRDGLLGRMGPLPSQ